MIVGFVGGFTDIEETLARFLVEWMGEAWRRRIEGWLTGYSSGTLIALPSWFPPRAVPTHKLKSEERNQFNARR